MKTFNEQLAATRANLDRLERLAEKAPELFERASGITVGEDEVRVYLHAWQDPSRDWKTMAARWPKANWKRERGSEGWNYVGIVDGVEVCMIGAEKKQESQPLFPGEAWKTEVGQIVGRNDGAMAETPVVEGAV